MSQPFLLSNWLKCAFSESISADPKSLNSFGQEATSRSEIRCLKRGEEEVLQNDFAYYL